MPLAFNKTQGDSTLLYGALNQPEEHKVEAYDGPQRWVKIPFDVPFIRGEGTWMKLEDSGLTEIDYERCKTTDYLPTYEGKEPID